eukprot:3617805-Rhodomonas_salina.1
MTRLREAVEFCDTFCVAAPQARQIAELRNITQGSLIEFYDTFIAPGAPKRRAISSMIVGKEARAPLSAHISAMLCAYA